MSKYLRPDEFMPFAPKARGEQVHVHHCRQGKDNDRLYIKRNLDGSVVAYCHHCGKRGLDRGDGTTPIHVLKNNSGMAEGTDTQSYVPPLTMPAQGSTEFKDWPAEALTWITRYGITQDEVRQYGIMATNFGSAGGYVALPVYNDSGVLDHFQRRFFGECSRERPKYDTVWRKSAVTGKDPAVASLHLKGKGSYKKQRVLFRGWYPDTTDAVRTSTVVIVEDTLSAIRCARHCDSVSLGTAHLDDDNLKKLLEEYDNFLIFLDNDKPQVIKEQMRLKRRLDMHAKGVVRLIKADRDPKEHTDKELEVLLCVTN